MNYLTIRFNKSFFISLSQFVVILKIFYKSVSIRKSNVKVGTVTFTKNTHQIPKEKKSVTESLKNSFLKLRVSYILNEENQIKS